MKNIFVLKLLTLLFGLFLACSSDDKQPQDEDPIITDDFIRAADVSFLPEAESAGAIYRVNGVPQNALTTLKIAGCNMIRIRVWHTPSNIHSSLTEAKILSQRARQNEMKVWLTVHYSDTWADPGHQSKPAAWDGFNFNQLKDAMTNYTAQLLQEIQPDVIQIGNEINVGLLFPEGHLIQNEAQCVELLQSAAQVVRQNRPQTKIMIHYAGLNGSDWFFNKMTTIDYDYIGISYYPIWHGKNLQTLSNTINSLGNTHNKKVIIAETAYPFTLGWNDWTNNILGLEEQLVTGYPATPQGQKEFLNEIKNIIKSSGHGLGFAYWAPEWISFRGNQAINGSSWENQALWDFDNNVLPAIEFFKKD